jgi:hypothetical protein
MERSERFNDGARRPAARGAAERAAQGPWGANANGRGVCFVQGRKRAPVESADMPTSGVRGLLRGPSYARPLASTILSALSRERVLERRCCESAPSSPTPNDVRTPLPSRAGTNGPLWQELPRSHNHLLGRHDPCRPAPSPSLSPAYLLFLSTRLARTSQKPAPSQHAKGATGCLRRPRAVSYHRSRPFSHSSSCPLAVATLPSFCHCCPSQAVGTTPRRCILAPSILARHSYSICKPQQQNTTEHQPL